MKKLLAFYRECRNAGTSFVMLVIRYGWFRSRGKNIFAHQKATIRGLDRIQTGGRLRIGVSYVGFAHQNDVTLMNVSGSLTTLGHCSIGRGCRWDIGRDAVVRLGSPCFINAFSTFIIMHGLEIGNDCAVSWNCQFLDEDFHEVDYPGKKPPGDKKIVIGNHVWIGCGVSIFKGSYIANGSVVASNSVVKGRFEEENVLIAGNPARIIKRNVKMRYDPSVEPS